MDKLVGKRVQIQASKDCGSVKLLNGLYGTVVGSHPIANNWVKVHLEPNPITPYEIWSVPQDRLLVEESLN